MNFKSIHSICLNLKNAEKIKNSKRFFKTGKGEYGEGDQFFGLTVPECRNIAKDFKELDLNEIEKLFKSKIHEERLIGIFILVYQFKIAIKNKNDKQQELLYKKYYSLRAGVNNWDLVDQSAPYLAGYYFFQHQDDDLVKLANSKDLWERRIAVLAIFYYIRQNSFKKALNVIESRLYDKEDLMHKACGWMLRELGKRDKKRLDIFLLKHADQMPRTTLRYAIEKHTVCERKKLMRLKKIKG